MARINALEIANKVEAARNSINKLSSVYDLLKTEVLANMVTVEMKNQCEALICNIQSRIEIEKQTLHKTYEV